MKLYNQKMAYTKVFRTCKDAIIPTYGTDGSGCFDLYSTDNGVIYPSDSAIFGTGLKFEIPVGKVMLVFSRSSHGFAHGVRLANSTAVIDSDYRGEVMIKLQNDNKKRGLEVKKGDRIAQAMLLDYDKISFVEVYSEDQLDSTERADVGLGSTGR